MYSHDLMLLRVCIAILVWLAAPVGAQHRNWTQTSNELVWRDKYTNCDKGWAVELPNGVIAHGSLPPNPNHGFLISAANPGTTNEVTLDVPRVIVISDEYDAMDLHTARAYLDFRLKNTKGARVLSIREATLQGVRGIQGRYKVESGTSEQIVECQIVLRRGIVYELLLRTTDQRNRPVKAAL